MTTGYKDNENHWRCSICWNSDGYPLVLNCGHSSVCDKCYMDNPQLSNCPICKIKIDNVKSNYDLGAMMNKTPPKALPEKPKNEILVLREETYMERNSRNKRTYCMYFQTISAIFVILWIVMWVILYYRSQGNEHMNAQCLVKNCSVSYEYKNGAFNKVIGIYLELIDQEYFKNYQANGDVNCTSIIDTYLECYYVKDDVTTLTLNVNDLSGYKYISFNWFIGIIFGFTFLFLLVVVWPLAAGLVLCIDCGCYSMQLDNAMGLC